MNTLRDRARRHPLWTFVVLAYAISWAIWIPRLLWPGAWSGRAAPLLHLAGSLGPAVAALIVAVAIAAAEARSIVQAAARWRVAPRWWVVAVLGPVAVVLIAAAIERIVGRPGPTWALVLRSEEYPGLGPVALVAAQLLFYGYGEEIGWRGFAWPKLLDRFGRLRAILLLSVIWAGWHVPLLASNPTYRAMGPALLLGWYASLLTGTALLSWLYEGSRGSLLLVAVFHALLDLVMVNRGVTPPMLATMGAVTTVGGLGAAVLLWRAPQQKRAPLPAPVSRSQLVVSQGTPEEGLEPPTR